MFKFVFLGLELIEIIVALSGIAICFYLFCEFVLPFFTFGAVKPGWLFFSKYQEKKAIKKAAREAAIYEAEKAKYQASVSKPEPEVEVTEEPKPEPEVEVTENPNPETKE